MLNKSIQDALNKQINSELYAAHLYLSMAAYFDAQDLPGIANWLKNHSTHEVAHAMRIFNFTAKRNGRVALTGISNPQVDFKSPEDAFQKALDLEIEVTQMIHDLFTLSHDSKEYGTQNMLNWFLEEQVEEEDTFRRILEMIKAAGDNAWHMKTLDRQLGLEGVSS